MSITDSTDDQRTTKTRIQTRLTAFVGTNSQKRILFGKASVGLAESAIDNGKKKDHVKTTLILFGGNSLEHVGEKDSSSA